jgi:LysM repeat protein
MPQAPKAHWTIAVVALSAVALATPVHVQPGDTLWTLAQAFNVSVQSLASLNHLSPNANLQIGEVLQVPSSTYTVQPGDTLSSIAALTGVSVAELEALNGIRNPTDLQVGEVLKLRAPLPSIQGPTATYTVRPGDTMESIALALGLSLASLEAANPGVNPNDLQIGQILRYPVVDRKRYRKASAPRAPEKPALASKKATTKVVQVQRKVVQTRRKVASIHPAQQAARVWQPLAVQGDIATYRLKPGQNLTEVADAFHTDLYTLKLFNPNLQLGGVVPAGTLLRIPMGLHAVVAEPGDSLDSIAHSHGLTVGEVLAVNPRLRYGEILPAGTVVLLPDSHWAVIRALGDGNPRLAVVAFAKRYLGYPYHLVGGNPAVGFSCVAFTAWVYDGLGFHIPGYLQGQLSAFPQVPRNQLKPGDIVFFQDTVWAGLSHAALYIGDGYIIHDANFEHGVQISSLSDPYWASHYLTAVDPIAGLGLSVNPHEQVEPASYRAP